MRATAEHEGRHVAAGLMLGVPLCNATAVPDPETGLAGSVTPDWDAFELDRDSARRLALLVLVGYDHEGWPPSWPSEQADTSDEYMLALLVKYMKLDAKSWQDLVDEARRLTCQKDFWRHENAQALLMEQGHVLDAINMKHVYAIVEARMEHKVKAASAVVSDLGQFTALAATWDLDRQQDRIMRGAFAKTITQWRESRKQLPVHWQHETSAEAIVGTVDPLSMAETTEGLQVSGSLDLEGSPVAREAWRSMKANAIGLSFGYLATGSHEHEDGTRVLTELDLFEISLTPAPVNAATRILSMKAMSPSEELRHRCIEAGVLPADIDSAQPAKTKSLDVDNRPITVASFEC